MSREKEGKRKGKGRFKKGRTRYMDLKVISGTIHPKLGKSIAKELGIKLTPCDIRYLPEREILVQIKENVRGSDLYIIQPTCYPANDNIMELLLLVDAARRASAHRITVVLPFYGYARQDRKDKPRVPISAKLVANMIVAAGAHRVVALDLHAAQIQGFFDIPVDHLYAQPVLIRAIRKLKIKDLVVASPDVGGVKRAEEWAKALKVDMTIVHKDRISPEKTKAVTVVGEVRDKNVLLVDDLTSTAGTLADAAVLLKKRGAKRVFAAVSHGVLQNKGHQVIADSVIERIFVTNSSPVVPQENSKLKLSVVPIEKLLAKAINNIHSGESVSELFRS